VTTSRTIEVTTIGSNHHVELNPSEAGIYDRVVVQDVIKEMAQSQNLDTKAPFKIVVLNEVDKLSKDAQHALRRTMEKYVRNCRLILCSESICRVIDPLRSRCLAVRVAAPTQPEVVNILQMVAKKEKITLPDTLAKNIANLSECNMRRALLMFEASKVEKYVCCYFVSYYDFCNAVRY
jgi:replication factor C subunit 3/5